MESSFSFDNPRFQEIHSMVIPDLDRTSSDVALGQAFPDHGCPKRRRCDSSLGSEPERRLQQQLQKSPRKVPIRKGSSCFPSLHLQSSQDSFTDDNDASMLDDSRQQRVGVEDIKQAQLKAVCRRMAVHGADLTRPSVVGPTSEDGGDPRLSYFLVETTRAFLSDGDDGDDDGYRYLWVASFLRAGGARLDEVTMGRLLRSGILAQKDYEARRAVHSLLSTAVLDVNPPLGEEAARRFLRVFCPDDVGLRELTASSA